MVRRDGFSGYTKAADAYWDRRAASWRVDNAIQCPFCSRKHPIGGPYCEAPFVWAVLPKDDPQFQAAGEEKEPGEEE
jgi:hypothetical protein